MASYTQLSRVARIVHGLLDLDKITDDELDLLLDCADDEEELLEVARQILEGSDRDLRGTTEEPALGGEQPDLVTNVFRRGFRLLRGGKARYLLEMTPGQWREALGSYAEGSTWPRNGYIVAVTRRRRGRYTEEFQDRWAPFVGKSGAARNA